MNQDTTVLTGTALVYQIAVGVDDACADRGNGCLESDELERP